MDPVSAPWPPILVALGWVGLIALAFAGRRLGRRGGLVLLVLLVVLAAVIA